MCHSHFFLMKKILFIFCMAIVGLITFAQQTDSISTTSPPKSRYMKAWRISELLAVADTIPPDTAFLNFQDHNVVDTFSIANAYNGNLGSPIQSKIYFKRPQGSDFIFEDPYRPYIADINSTRFYDVKFPFTNLTYRTGGSSFRKEDQVKFTFATSPSKNKNFGADLDYIYAIGEYANQSAKRFSGSLFGRYSGKHYSAYALAATNNHQNYESGGISDLNILQEPLGRETQDFPVYMTAYSAFQKNVLYYSHSYNIGFNRSIKVTEDSTRLEYVPITHFGHTIQYNELRKRYYEPTAVQNYYDTTYVSGTAIPNDTAAIRSLSNVLYINLDEKFNKWMKFGLTGYIENEIQQYIYMQDTVLTKATKSNTRLGGILSKNRGANFRYNLLGDIYLLGYKLGEFRLNGEATGIFKLWNENISLSAHASIHNEQPSMFLQHYHSRHFRWDNDFSKTYRTAIGGTFSLPQRKTTFKLDVENISNVIYFNEKALPTQLNGNVQIISADIRQDFKLSHIVLENHVVYQLTSNSNVIPLPDFSLYHNLYYTGKWFQVLTTQLGVNLRMHTKYYTPLYMPATGQFYVQKETQIGNYPIMNLYANFHLKQARFFLEFYHFNRWFMQGDYYSMPNYPLNPTVLKMGLSWNFYN